MSSLRPETTNTRFLVAKYIPDMRRLEPRNIGVMVWTSGRVSARFLGEESSAAGKCRIPRRLGIQNQNAYREWIHYWRSQMVSPMLSVNGNGQRVSSQSSEFFDALKQRSKENFVLVDGGFIAGAVDPVEIDDVVHDLFEGLVDDSVETKETGEEESILLKKSVSHVFQASGIDAVHGYQAKLPLTFAVESHVFGFTFDYGIYTNAPHAVFQHATLARPMSVNSAAFMFNCIGSADVNTYKVSKERRLALVRTTPALLDSELSRRELDKLKAYATVVDLAHEECSINELRKLSLSI